jgi:hypothetical protein
VACASLMKVGSHVCAPAYLLVPRSFQVLPLVRTPNQILSQPSLFPAHHHRLQFCTHQQARFACDETSYGQLSLQNSLGVLAAFRTRSVCNIISQPHGLPQLLHTTHCARPVIAPSTTDRRNLSRARTQSTPI